MKETIRKGDTVKCLRSDGYSTLTEGKEYKARQDEFGPIFPFQTQKYLSVTDDRNSLLKGCTAHIERFKLVERAEPTLDVVTSFLVQNGHIGLLTEEFYSWLRQAITDTNSLNTYHRGHRFSIHRCRPGEYARLPRNLFWMVIETYEEGSIVTLTFYNEEDCKIFFDTL